MGTRRFSIEQRTEMSAILLSFLSSFSPFPPRFSSSTTRPDFFFALFFRLERPIYARYRSELILDDPEEKGGKVAQLSERTRIFG